MYSKKDFGRELTEEINKNFDTGKISWWAHEKYLDHASILDKETYRAIMTIIAMDEGEEFEMTKEELLKFAANLQK